MIVLGLTGSIGMGKSTAAGMLRRLGVPLFDADAVVHRLLGPGGDAVAAVEALFPGVRDETGAIDRRRARTARVRRSGGAAAARSDPAPDGARGRDAVCRRRRGRGAKAWSCSTSRSYSRPARPSACDYVLVVSAPARVQRERVMRRPGMTESRFASILRAQMPDREKRRRADFVVPTGLGRGLTFRRLRRVVAELRHERAARACRAAQPGGGDNARNRDRHRDHRPRSRRRTPDRRDRLHRADAPRPDRAEIPPLRQSRARHAGGGALPCMGSAPSSWRNIRALPRSPTSCSPLSATTGWSSTMPSSILPFSMPSWRGSAGRRSACAFVDTLAVARAALSRRAGQPRRAVPPLRDRSERAREARRRDRLRPLGRGLSRAARRPSAGARFRGECRRRRLDQERRRAAPDAAAAAAASCRPKRSWRRTRRCWPR